MHSRKYHSAEQVQTMDKWSGAERQQDNSKKKKKKKKKRKLSKYKPT